MPATRPAGSLAKTEVGKIDRLGLVASNDDLSAEKTIDHWHKVLTYLGIRLSNSRQKNVKKYRKDQQS